MAKPYKEGKGWSMRQQVRGHDLYVSGQSSAAQARKEMAKRVDQFGGETRPFGLGPFDTTLGRALLDFGRHHLPRLKGAEQECRRINRYLRLAGLPALEVEMFDQPQQQALTTAEVSLDKLEGNGNKHKTSKRGRTRTVPQVYCSVRVAQGPATQSRVIPNGLHAHRAAQAQRTAGSDRIRTVLASTPVAKVARHQLQQLVDQMRTEGAPATAGLERALLRRFFNYARGVWHWAEPHDNPATLLVMPRIDNERKRTMSAKEEERMNEALNECRNQLMGPTARLLTATAMRASEPLEHACWKDVHWDRRILHLQISKNDSRDVPLSDKALAALKELQALSSGQPDSRIVEMTYEALKAAWTRACERAGIEDLVIHDLRRTAATRTALEFGNIFLVKALTGHKTWEMVMRYTQTGAEHLVQAWKDQSPKEETAAVPPAQAPTVSGLMAPTWTTPAPGHLPTPVRLDMVPQVTVASANVGWSALAWGTPVAPSAAIVSEPAPVLPSARVISVDFSKRRAS